MLSTDQLQELIDIVNQYHIVFLAKEVGKDVLTKQDKNILKSIGFKEEYFPDISRVEQSFRFGLLASAVGDERVKKMTYSQFKRFLSNQEFLPLSEIERGALKSVKMQTYSDIKGLGNKISKDLSTTLIEVDKKQRIRNEKIIRQESIRAIENRSTINQLSSALAKKTGDYLRDFDRISDYVMHQAYDEGRAMQILKQRGENALVYKQPQPEACETCVGAYLQNGQGSKPIVFELKELIENGTNIGRNKDQSLPTIGPMHPWCRCTLQVIPKGFKWDSKKKDFSKPIPIVRRTEAKIKITVGGKEID